MSKQKDVYMVVVSIDGIDGTGKSSIVGLVRSRFEKSTVIETSHREDILPDVRKILNTSLKDFIVPRFVYYTMLNQMAANQIKNMDKDTVVIMDRSVYSTYAYHIAYDKYYNCGSNLLKINVIGKAANSSIRFPDISIFLYVDEEERVKRLVRRETKLNESNDFDTDVLKLVNAEFQYIAKGLRENGQVVYEFDTTNLDKEGVLEKIVSAIKNTQKQFDFVKVPNYYYRFKL